MTETLLFLGSGIAIAGLVLVVTLFPWPRFSVTRDRYYQEGDGVLPGESDPF